MTQNGTMVASDEWERMANEAVVACFKMILRYFSGGLRKTTKTFVQEAQSLGQCFEYRTSRM